MIRIDLSVGLTVEVDPGCFDDMELLDAITGLETNPQYRTTILDKVLGAAQKKALYSAVRAADGRVHMVDVDKALEEIFQGLGPAGKKS